MEAEQIIDSPACENQRSLDCVAPFLGDYYRNLKKKKKKGVRDVNMCDIITVVHPASEHMFWKNAAVTRLLFFFSLYESVN